MAWKVAKGISQGTNHIEGNIPCQDYVDCIKIPEYNMILGAVSDGVGSAKRAEIGSELVVTKTLSFLKSWNWNVGIKDENDAREVFHQRVIEIVLAALKQTAESNTCSVHDFACTLLVFIATPEWFIATQVGDGFIVVRQPEGDYELVFKPDKGEFANYTTSITDITPSNVSRKMKVCFKKNHYSFICASTDGLENISLIQKQDYKPYDKFFKPLEDHIVAKDSSDPEDDDELNEFLNSEKINAKTEDDKTLLLCAYEELSPMEGLTNQATFLPVNKPEENVIVSSSLVEQVSTSKSPIIQHSTSGNPTAQNLEIAVEKRLDTILAPEVSISRVKVQDTTLEVRLKSDNKPVQKEVIEEILKEIHKSEKKSIKIRKLQVYNQSKNKSYDWQKIVKITQKNKSNIFIRTINIPVIVLISMCIALFLALIGMLKIINMRIFIYCICLSFCIYIVYRLYIHSKKKRSD